LSLQYFDWSVRIDVTLCFFSELRFLRVFLRRSLLCADWLPHFFSSFALPCSYGGLSVLTFGNGPFMVDFLPRQEDGHYVGFAMVTILPPYTSNAELITNSPYSADARHNFFFENFPPTSPFPPISCFVSFAFPPRVALGGIFFFLVLNVNFEE